MIATKISELLLKNIEGHSASGWGISPSIYLQPAGPKHTRSGQLHCAAFC